ncbi:hypothetical protein AB0I45_08725 [Brevibacterium sp. NPDC049920]|uniref:Uncharacterized protein n=1 Tax=Brevibacterium pityocampae TaxID=506594 RepID=A0ABP8JIA9_9MICO|nr:hypothetical protein [uncultured Brevibacterium sp.]
MQISNVRTTVRDLLGRRAVWWWAAIIASVIVLAVLIGFDMLHRLNTTRGAFPAFADPLFNADRDRGFAETLGYLQLVVAAGALIYTALHLPRARIHYAIAAAFLVVIADDSLELHENWGGALAERFGFESGLGLRGQDFGELLAWGLMGIPVVLALGISWILSGARARRQAWVIVAGLAALVLFAAILDMLHPASGLWGWPERLRYGVTLLEVVGEIGSMIFIMAASLFFALRQRVEKAERRADRPAAG